MHDHSGSGDYVLAHVTDCNPLLQQINSLKQHATSLQKQITDIQSEPGYTQGPHDPHPGKPDPESLAEVKELESQLGTVNKQVAMKTSEYDACQSAHTKAVLDVVCDNTQCVSISDVYANIAARLNGKVVGYACSVGRSLTYKAHGYARTSANAPAQNFLSSTKMPVASVSKVVTALAAIRVLAKHGISLDSPISGHFPSDWTLDPSVAAITFRELLSHRSGIKAYGNVPQDYESVKEFFTQKVDLTKNTQCTGPEGPNQPAPADPINPNLMDPSNPKLKKNCYSNWNFAVFRILLPMIDGFVDDSANRAAKLAAAYVKLVQTNVFEPVGAIGVDCKPPTSGPQSSAYAFSYKFPGSSSGHDWGDDTLIAGAAGWYLSVEDIAEVLASLNKNDGRILTSAQLQDMQTMPLGWDTLTDATGYRWVQKNGGWSAAGTTIGSSIALFGPGVLGVLFINSDRSGPGLQNNWQLCTKCQALVFAGNPSFGNCPAGGLHTGTGNYLVPTNASGIIGQDNWRWCNKCQVLSFAGSPSLGPCPGGGQHDHSGSADYVLPKKTAALPEYSQDKWKWCKKCQVLAFAGSSSASVCRAGGAHDYTASGDYVLEYAVGADTILHDAYMKALKPHP